MAITTTEKQSAFIDAVFSGRYKYLGYGGAIRGGKTVAGILAISLLCLVFPGSVWCIVRKTLPTLRRTTMRSFTKFSPRGFFGPINRETWTATARNGSQVIFMSEMYERDNDLDRFKGLEVNGFFAEEANELSEPTFEKMMERAGTWSISHHEQPPPLILMTFNPARGWIKQNFYDPFKRGQLEKPFFYQPASVFDNPHLTPAYLESLEELKKKNPKAYARFVMGDWEYLADPDQLISYELIDAAIELGRSYSMSGPRRMGVDVARYGEDSTTIAPCLGDLVSEVFMYEKISVTRTAEIATALMSEYRVSAEDVRVDTVGIGSGVADIMRKNGHFVSEFIAGAAAYSKDEKSNTGDMFLTGFKNLRSRGWWELRKRFEEGRIALNPKMQHLKLLVEELATPRYEISGDRVISVESKDDMRRRLGRSTDAADAVMMALATMPKEKKSWAMRMAEMG